MTRSQTKAIGALIGPIGLILGLLGYVGDVYSSSTATILMLGVWLVGGTLVRIGSSSAE
jgi:hypothetical protein